MQDMVQVEMVKTYFKYDGRNYWFLTPNWSPYGCKYDWWSEGERIAGRIVDKRFTNKLTTLYERRLKLEKIKNKIDENS